MDEENPDRSKFKAYRQRIEDLGRISELLSQVLDSDLFDLYEYRHMESFIEAMKNEEKAEETFRYLKRLDELISEAYQVARWGDDC